MKFSILVALVLWSLNSFAAESSFETVRDGKTYICTEKPSNPTSGSLSALCRMAQRGHGETIYHPNGNIFTSSAGTRGATWYYANGNIITSSAGSSGATWYYSNGNILTSAAGTVGATYYHFNGNIMTSSAGSRGATWYYENGSIMTSSGPEMSADELRYLCDYIK